MTALNLTLAVNDPDVSVQFYRDILNLRVELSDQSDFFIVSFHNIKVLFQRLAQLEQQHPAFLQHLGRSPLGVGVQFEVECADLEAVERRLAGCGWPIIYELDDREHKRRELWVQDPDGYVVVLNSCG